MVGVGCGPGHCERRSRGVRDPTGARPDPRPAVSLEYRSRQPRTGSISISVCRPGNRSGSSRRSRRNLHRSQTGWRNVGRSGPSRRQRLCVLAPGRPPSSRRLRARGAANLCSRLEAPCSTYRCGPTVEWTTQHRHRLLDSRYTKRTTAAHHSESSHGSTSGSFWRTVRQARSPRHRLTVIAADGRILTMSSSHAPRERGQQHERDCLVRAWGGGHS
jgi:hypothetical protein